MLSTNAAFIPSWIIDLHPAAVKSPFNPLTTIAVEQRSAKSLTMYPSSEAPTSFPYNFQRTCSQGLVLKSAAAHEKSRDPSRLH